MTNYSLLNLQLKSLTDGIQHKTANLANASALIYNTLPDLNWAGFYLMEDGVLVLGPFQGKPACIEIPVGRGVCGAAAAECRTKLVHDVHKFPGQEGIEDLFDLGAKFFLVDQHIKGDNQT